MHSDPNRSEPNNDLSSTSLALLNRICAGDPYAQVAFVQLWAPPLKRYFEHALRSIPAADYELHVIILLRKFCELVTARKVRLDESPAPLIWHMARQKAIDAYLAGKRAQKLSKELESQAKQQGFKTFQSSREFKENLTEFHRLARAHDKITEEQAEAIMLHISGLKDKEIARIFGKTRSRICQMRSEYRASIKRWLSDDPGASQAFGDLLT